MEGKVFKDKAVLRIDKGEEVIESVLKFAEKENIKLGSITGIGASDDIVVGLFNTDTKKYEHSTYNNDYYEVTNFSGNLTMLGDKHYTHMHITFSDGNQKTFGGHLDKCVISGACELFIDIVDGNINRQKDENVGLNVLKF